MVGSSRSGESQDHLSTGRAAARGGKLRRQEDRSIANKSTCCLVAAPMPLRRSREDTHRQSIGWLSASFGMDANHCSMSCFASSSQERFIVDSFIPAHRSRYPPSACKNVQQTNVRIPLCENTTMRVRMTVFITKPRADTSVRSGLPYEFSHSANVTIPQQKFQKSTFIFEPGVRNKRSKSTKGTANVRNTFHH